MCNVRYEYTNNNNHSLLEQGFDHVYVDYMGMVYRCKICETIVKSALDAFMHMKNYHGITTLDKLQAYFELKKTVNEIKKRLGKRSIGHRNKYKSKSKMTTKSKSANRTIIKSLSRRS